MTINELRDIAKLSPCKVIKFAVADGTNFSYNGEFYADCSNCKRTKIEQSYPECKANHAEWGILAKAHRDGIIPKVLYIYCMTPDGKDYPFKTFWCRTCAILIPMFGIDSIYMWNGEQWIFHDPTTLIYEMD